MRVLFTPGVNIKCSDDAYNVADESHNGPSIKTMLNICLLVYYVYTVCVYIVYILCTSFHIENIENKNNIIFKTLTR